MRILSRYKLFFLNAIAILVLGFILGHKYSNVLFEQNIIGPFKDNTYLIGPVLSYLQNSAYPFKDFQIDGIFYGLSFYDNAMLSTSYPLFFFNLLDYTTPFNSLRSLSLLTVIHIFILCLGNYLLGKTLRLGILPSLVMATIPLTCLSLYSFTSWGLNIVTLAWFPYVIIALIGISKNKLPLLSVAVLSLGCLFITAKPSQPFIQIVLLSFILFIPILLSSENKLKTIAYTSLAGMIGFCISAKAFLPAFLNIDDKMRWVGKGKSLIGNEPLTLEDYSPYFNSDITELLFLSDSVGSGPGHIFIGFIALALTACCFLKTQKKVFIYPLYFTCLALFLYFLMSCFDKPFNLTKINQHIPLLNKMRQPVRHSLTFPLLIPIMAGLGFKKLSESNRYVKFTITLIIISITIYNAIVKGSSPMLALLILPTFFLLPNWKEFNTYKNTMLAAILLCSVIILNTFIPSTKVYPEGKWFINDDKYKTANSLLALVSDNMSNKLDRVSYDNKLLRKSEFSMTGLYHRLRSFDGAFAPIPVDNFFYKSSGKKLQKYLGATHVLTESKAYNNRAFSGRITLNDSYELRTFKDANSWCYHPNKFITTAETINKSLKSNKLENLLIIENTAINNTEEKANFYQDKSLYANKCNVSYSYQKDFIQIDASCNKRSLLVINEKPSQHWILKDSESNSIAIIKLNQHQFGFIIEGDSKTYKLFYIPKIIKILNLAKYFGYALILCILILYLRTVGGARNKNIEIT